MTTYIIEHLEPEIYPWCLTEYKNISKITGKDNLWFTNVKGKSKNSEELKNYGKVIKESVANLNLKNACVLDPEASKLLEPKEAKSFDYFIFGGILGDYPPRKRTTPELTSKIKNAEARNIGKKQFSTDNAVLVVKNILSGTPLDKMEFINNLVIHINKIESIELPYCYPIINGKPQISKELVAFLKKKKTF
jgi:ribosome biogenesis SPOUT family RNA methylase Rps3